jgi:hypothetical protein
MRNEKNPSLIPIEIMREISAGAKAEWPDDREMQDYFIGEESNGYLAVHSADFAAAECVKDSIMAEAYEFFETWEERASFIKDEIGAYLEIQSLPPDDIPEEVFRSFKAAAAAENDWLSLQLDSLNHAIAGYRYVQRTRKTVGPIRELLVRMEEIIGQECYNGNIQNYSSWGEWDGEGRSFRYPVTFIRKGEEEKRRSQTIDLQHEELVTGHYKFGANELSIYRALIRVIDMLEADYGFQRPKHQ